MRWLILLVLAGCYQPTAVADCRLACSTDESCPAGMACNANGVCSAGSSCATDPDASVSDVPPGAVCGTGFAQPCVVVPPGALSLVGKRSTDADLPCMDVAQLPAPPMCVVASDTITASVGTHIIGSRPLVLVGRLVTIDELSVASFKADGDSGAGACTMPGVDGTIGVDGPLQVGGGGAGGTHAGRGGSGGGASTAAGTNGDGGTAEAPALAFPTHVIGGCPGGRGAEGAANGTFGEPGAGGGAVYIVATEQIVVSGRILAGGAGGRGGGALTGGGGGGAGGLIVLDSPKVVLVGGAKLIAAGGGGAAGGDLKAGDNGNEPNYDVTPVSSITANGGSGNGGAGDGGVGSTPGNNRGGNGAMGSAAGGGGGGGGAGFIVIYPGEIAIGTNAIIFPTQTPVPQ